MSRPAGLLPLVLLLPFLLGAGGLTPQEERGRRIYVEATSPSGGEMVAVLGEGVEVEASAVPCASCHGRDGKGRPEGGVTPTDITWANLTKPYGVTHPSGRRHPPYDERLMKRSLAMGFDPADNVLHVAMPRYRMSYQDMADLVAYLKTLGPRRRSRSERDRSARRRAAAAGGSLERHGQRGARGSHGALRGRQ